MVHGSVHHPDSVPHTERAAAAAAVPAMAVTVRPAKMPWQGLKTGPLNNRGWFSPSAGGWRSKTGLAKSVSLKASLS